MCEGNKGRFLDHMLAFNQWVGLRSRGYSENVIIQYAERLRETRMAAAAGGFGVYTLAVAAPDYADYPLLNEAQMTMQRITQQTTPFQSPSRTQPQGQNRTPARSPSAPGGSGSIVKDPAACLQFENGYCHRGDEKCRYTHYPKTTDGTATDTGTTPSADPATTKSINPPSGAGTRSAKRGNKRG
jgi:hypothetical protein